MTGIQAGSLPSPDPHHDSTPGPTPNTAPAPSPYPVPEQCQNPSREQIKRWRRYLAEERDEARIYRAIAKKRHGINREILIELADAEKRHEDYWLALLGEHAEPAPRSPWYARLLQALAIRIGSIFVLAMMQRSEERDTYDLDDDATPQMAADEHLHSEVVRALAARSRARFSGKARAMIFGVNDGLVSNLALVAGIAGTGVSTSIVLMTGFTGLVSGALSMGAGEYISVTSQRELLESSLPNPNVKNRIPMLDRASNELKLLFMARGESAEAAVEHARALLDNLDQSTTSTVDDFGDEISSYPAAFDPNPGDEFEAIGSGRQAAISSFLSFTIGALIPLLPFIFGLQGPLGTTVAVILVGAILLVIGGTIGVLSGKPPFLRALRQAAIGIGAATVTYLLGVAAGGLVAF